MDGHDQQQHDGTGSSSSTTSSSSSADGSREDDHAVCKRIQDSFIDQFGSIDAALFTSVRSDEAVIRLLVDERIGANVNARIFNESTNSVHTPLHEAIAYVFCKTGTEAEFNVALQNVRVLLELGADPNAPRLGEDIHAVIMAPVLMAGLSYICTLENVTLPIFAIPCASPEDKDEPMGQEDAYVKVVRTLVEFGGDVNGSSQHYGSPLRQYAITCGPNS
jgi:hypothetical protein